MTTNSPKKRKTHFSYEDFETDAQFEKRKAKEARKKAADEALYALMLREGFGG